MKKLIFFMAAMLLSMSVAEAQTKKTSTVRKTTVLSKNSQTKSVPVTREFKVEQDGFEWFLVKKGGKVGAESKDGKNLIPTEMSYIYYQYNSQSAGPGFQVTKSGDKAYYSPDGECVIPFSRHYHIINKERDTSVGTYYWGWTTSGGPLFFCNADGEEVCQIDGYSLAEPHFNNGKFFWKVCLNTHDENNWCIMDGNGNMKYGPSEFVYCEADGTITGKRNGKYVELGNVSTIATTNNPFAKANKMGIRYSSTANSSSSSNSSAISSSSSSSSNSSNSGSGTTTIHVEHHHDPVPMQVWKQCTGCYGSGMCQSGCGGSGWFTGYSGNSTRCFGCGGSGKCQFCAGKGGHYEVEYR